MREIIYILNAQLHISFCKKPGNAALHSESNLYKGKCGLLAFQLACFRDSVVLSLESSVCCWRMGSPSAVHNKIYFSLKKCMYYVLETLQCTRKAWASRRVASGEAGVWLKGSRGRVVTQEGLAPRSSRVCCGCHCCSHLPSVSSWTAAPLSSIDRKFPTCFAS